MVGKPLIKNDEMPVCYLRKLPKLLPDNLKRYKETIEKFFAAIGYRSKDHTEKIDAFVIEELPSTLVSDINAVSRFNAALNHVPSVQIVFGKELTDEDIADMNKVILCTYNRAIDDPASKCCNPYANGMNKFYEYNQWFVCISNATFKCPHQ